MSKSSSFQVEPELARLKGTYPPSDDMRTAIGTGERERRTVARLWLSEGIPYAFRECPALYEEVRSWLAAQLEVHPKAVGMVGSGRIGYSMKPREWGCRYDPSSSDLDLLVVSASLFDRLKQDFQRWRRDYDHGLVKPGE